MRPPRSAPQKHGNAKDQPMHEVSRIAEQALARARRVREETPAVQARLQRLDRMQEEVRMLGGTRKQGDCFPLSRVR
jgi:hypothetical protein